MSRSQAPLCFCTQRTIANRAEVTFALLRYSLGGDRPSQTARLTMSQSDSRDRLECMCKEWYFTNGSKTPGDASSKPPTYPTQLHTKANAKLQ